jgi:hypothetical protein
MSAGERDDLPDCRLDRAFHFLDHLPLAIVEHTSDCATPSGRVIGRFHSAVVPMCVFIQHHSGGARPFAFNAPTGIIPPPQLGHPVVSRSAANDRDCIESSCLALVISNPLTLSSSRRCGVRSHATVVFYTHGTPLGAASLMDTLDSAAGELPRGSPPLLPGSAVG